MSNLRHIDDPNVLVGFEGKDDAAVYKIREDLCLVQTMDFFPPVVDDPYDYGRIAAANAISDIYAMGAKPLMALNILTFPSCVPLWAVKEILRGGNETALAADLNILGGHSIEDQEPKYGMAVLGVCHPDELLSNAGAQAGDVLILTKKLGTGIMTTALKGGLIESSELQETVESMALLNRRGMELCRPYEPHAATDVTGFGLVGHGLELAEGSGVDIAIYSEALPSFKGAIDFASWGILPAGAYHNRDFAGERFVVEGEVPRALADLACDPQTSGGLLLAVPRERASDLLDKYQEAGQFAVPIGEVLAPTAEPRFILKAGPFPEGE